MSQKSPEFESFVARLTRLKHKVQESLMSLPITDGEPRQPVYLRLTLDELVSILPPRQKEIGMAIIAGTDLRTIVNTSSSRNRRLIALVCARLKKYCGTYARFIRVRGYSLRQSTAPYPGPDMIIWLPSWFVTQQNLTPVEKPFSSRHHQRRAKKRKDLISERSKRTTTRSMSRMQEIQSMQ